MQTFLNLQRAVSVGSWIVSRTKHNYNNKYNLCNLQTNIFKRLFICCIVIVIIICMFVWWKHVGNNRLRCAPLLFSSSPFLFLFKLSIQKHGIFAKIGQTSCASGCYFQVCCRALRTNTVLIGAIFTYWVTSKLLPAFITSNLPHTAWLGSNSFHFFICCPPP